jgi:light-regulated signal transduction histidine kinase (bacteriophytochrome)
LKKRPREFSSLLRLQSIDEKLICDLAHKLKNGLGGISGFASLLERDNQTEAVRKRYLKRIQEGVASMNQLVVSLMTLARARIDIPEHKQLDISSVVKSAWKSSLAYDANNFRGEVLPAQKEKIPCAAAGDPNLLLKIFSYAIQFIHGSGGKMEKIQWAPVSGKTVKVDFIYHMNGSGCGKKSLSPDLSNLDELPIESRISVEIVRTLLRLQSGRFSCKYISERKRCFSIYMQRGQYA